jgi:nitrogen fixation protein
MKNIFLLTLPITLSTILANADQLEFTKSLPIDSKLPVAENTLINYENRINIGMGGLTYERIKQDAAYVGIGTTIYRNGVVVIAMGGYNFLLSEKDVIRPVAGLGYYTGEKDLIAPLVGVGYEHAFNNTFTLGANVARVLVGDSNYTVSVPVMFHFGEQKKWEFRLIPMVAHNGGPLISFNKTGLGLSLGYRF